MVCSIQEFVKAITAELRKATPEVREDFRQAWWAAFIERERSALRDRTALRLTGDDMRWLSQMRIDPSDD
jgi:hypothetical protein